MFHGIEKVRMGIIRPEELKIAESTRRALNLSLSNTTTLEPVFNSSVTSLDVDSTGKYLLSSTNNAGFYIHDTYNLSTMANTINPFMPSSTLKCQLNSCSSKFLKGDSYIQWYPLDTGLFSSTSQLGYLLIWDPNRVKKPVEIYGNYRGNSIYFTYHHMSLLQPNLIAVVTTSPDMFVLDMRIGRPILTLPSPAQEKRKGTSLPVNDGVKYSRVRWNSGIHNLLTTATDKGHIVDFDIRSTTRFLKSYSREIEFFSGSTSDIRKGLYKAHNRHISSLRFSRNGQTLYSFGCDNKVRVWDVYNEKKPLSIINVLPRIDTKPLNLEIDISGDTNPPVVYVPWENDILIYNVNKGLHKKIYGHIRGVTCFAYDPINQMGYSGGRDCSVLLHTSNISAEKVANEERYSLQRNEQQSHSQSKPFKLIDDIF